MFKTILLPIDVNHPESWDKALPMARRLLAPDGTLHLLGIVHDIGSAMVAAALPPNFEEISLKHMKSALEDFRLEHCADLSCETHVGHGHVADTIVRAADKAGAEVIVMASHPPSDLRTLLVGSNADRVVRHATLPVMVVR
ncbi:Nucleotide-binding universal stress protein, UspA family [Tranquillimonas rosea]|uniref:Nucleotide-binding universal stress protein, UspA family n=1 Tax=Tranquillimonas rosea TaxID=641238 RepID=A0A1H9VT37_9RHOB|nr:universal stress protein [Tranquillimonas rosea]SES24674.1 Nucleotide-binding universal stress protein, UspA family [Tranquillimonas rosea]